MTKATLPEEVREAMARALVAYNTIPEFYEQEWPKCLLAADAALSALEAAGWACVPMAEKMSAEETLAGLERMEGVMREKWADYGVDVLASARAHIAALQREADGLREALDALWRRHVCHKVQDAAIYCGLCDGDNAPEGSPWREVPHEPGCAFRAALAPRIGIDEVRCVNAHDRCYGGDGAPCPYCEPRD